MIKNNFDAIRKQLQDQLQQQIEKQKEMMNEVENKVQNMHNGEESHPKRRDLYYGHGQNRAESRNMQNFNKLLKRIGRVEAEIEKDKNEIKIIKDNLQQEVITLNKKSDFLDSKANWTNGLLIGIVVVLFITFFTLWWQYYAILPNYQIEYNKQISELKNEYNNSVSEQQNTINLQQEKIQNLEDDVKELENIIKTYFIKSKKHHN